MDMNQAGRNDKSVGYHVGQVVRFFNPFNGDRSEQIAEGKVIEVDHWMQTLTVFINTAQVKEAGWFVGNKQVVKMSNPYIEIVSNEKDV
tara:strand:+ start:247 stop:513 length:267 start_codon:yes stop_codon:yes gene_type:complete